MTSTRNASPTTWLTPARVAKACGGKVARRGKGHARRVATDTRTIGERDLFVALTGDQFDGHDFIPTAIEAGAAGVVVDRRLDGVHVPDGVFVVRVEDTTAALGAIAAEHRRRHRARIAAITGSCGKTSVKDMLGRALASSVSAVWSPASFNNQIGVPLSLLQIEEDTEVAVVEVGTNAPGEIAALASLARPDVGIITCVSEAHLSGLGSLGGVAVEKASLLGELVDDGVAVLNGDDPSCQRMAAECDRRVVTVRVGCEADWFATDVRFSGLGTSFRLQGDRPVTLPRLGSHNVHNALLTIAAADALGVDLEPVLTELSRTPASSRRMESREVGEVLVFDDTYNMNPASARAALDALAGLPRDGKKVVVFGEMLELGSRSDALHRELGAEVARAGVDCLVTVGDGADHIAAGAVAAGMPKRRVLRASDPRDALGRIVDRLGRGDLVLCKASRRVGLDRLVDGLTRELGSRGDRTPEPSTAVAGGGG